MKLHLDTHCIFIVNPNATSRRAACLPVNHLLHQNMGFKLCWLHAAFEEMHLRCMIKLA